MRWGGPLAATIAAGCALTAHFDRFDTSPSEEVFDGGTVQGSITMSIEPRTVHVRPDAPAAVTVKVARAGLAPAPVTVHLDGLPGELSAPDVVVAPDETEKTIAIAATSASGFGARLGTSVSVLVTATDAGGTPIAPSSVAIELWGEPGEIDPTRPSGTLSFDVRAVQDDLLTGQAGLPIHVADFVGTTLAVAAGTSLVTVDADGKTTTTPLEAGPGPDTAFADGDLLNVVSSVNQGGTTQTLPTFATTVRRGRLGTLVAGAPLAGGSRCAIDREGRRLACRSQGQPQGGCFAPYGYDVDLLSLDDTARGQQLYTANGADVSAILHTAHGWALVGTKATCTGMAAGGQVTLLDDGGTPVQGFAFAPWGTFFADALADDAGLLVAGEDFSAVVARCDWTGALVTSFAASNAPPPSNPNMPGTGPPPPPDGKLHLPGGAVLGLAASSRGILAATCSRPPQTGDLGSTLVTRFDPNTGAIDDAFGQGGTVSLSGTGAPIAIREVNDRIWVAYLTGTGAATAVLFP